MIVKVCGMRDADNIRAVESLGVDMMGFIFAPRSKRFVPSVPRYMPGCQRVGVFVDAPAEEIEARIDEYGLSWVQLHGDETPRQCRLIGDRGVKVIKALQISDAASLQAAQAYHGAVDMLLLDTASAARGGSGRRFDWSLLERYDGPTGFLLSGGIGPESIDDIRALHHPQMIGVDLNSRFETAAAYKDIDTLSMFIRQIRQI